MEDEPSVKNLEETNCRSSFICNENFSIVYFQTDFAGKCDGEDIVRLAQVVVPGVVFVNGVLGSDGETGEDDDDHDELVEGGSTDKPVDQLSNTADIINIRLYFDQGKSF